MVWNKEACERADEHLAKAEEHLERAKNAEFYEEQERRALLHATMSLAWSKKAERVYS